jgi:hypothetical protein
MMFCDLGRRTERMALIDATKDVSHGVIEPLLAFGQRCLPDQLDSANYMLGFV